MLMILLNLLKKHYPDWIEILMFEKIFFCRLFLNLKLRKGLSVLQEVLTKNNVQLEN